MVKLVVTFNRKSMKFFNKCAVAASLITVSLFSCKPDRKIINIKGDIKDLDAEMAYLSATYPVGSKPIDSARVIDGKFEFNIHTDTVFQPFLGHITYRGKSGMKDCCGVINPNSPDKNKPDRYFDFYIEPGPMLISGDLTVDKYGVNLKAGPQNDFNFRYINLPLSVPSRNPAVHKRQFESFRNIVKNNPSAYPAIFTLDNWRYYLTNGELKEIYQAFDTELQQSNYGKQVHDFFTIRPEAAALRVNEPVIDTAGKLLSLIDTTKKLNMIIFWASWCGPCKMEIPSLKKFAASVKNNQLKISSVSIDKDKTRWKNEVLKQNMPWQQFAFNNNDLSRAITEYNLNSIPQIFFIDSHRKLVADVKEYDPANEATIQIIVDKNLN